MENNMIEILSGLISFVTATVSFLYGTRIAWVCGKKCTFKESPANRKQLLSLSLPAATALYLFGFLVIFIYLFDGFVTVLIPALMCATLCPLLLVSMAMPELRRKRQATEVTGHLIHKNPDPERNASKWQAFGFGSF
jgi:polyferredoxin